MTRKTRRGVAGLGLLALCCRIGAADLTGADSHVEFKLNAPTMVGALIQFTQQSGLQLMYPTDGSIQIAAPKVQGSLTPRAALEHLLQDSGLTFEFVNNRTVLVKTRETTQHTMQDPGTSPAVARQRD